MLSILEDNPLLTEVDLWGMVEWTQEGKALQKLETRARVHGYDEGQDKWHHTLFLHTGYTLVPQIPHFP